MQSWRNSHKPKRPRTRFRIPRSVLGVFMALAVLLSLILPTNYALAEGVTDLSLYQRASELTREFATALAPGSKTENLHMIYTTNDGDDGEPNGMVVAGNAGAFLGYADVLADDKGFVGWLMSSYTSSSVTITYDQLMNVVGDSGDNVYDAALHNPFFQYAGYGEVLTEMGLAKTIRPGIDTRGRVVATGFVIIVYLLANAAPFVFRGALMILTALNPFKLFETAINGIGGADLGILSGVATYVGDIYMVIQDFSMYFLLPALLIMTVIGVLMFQKGQAMKRFGRYALRVFMLFAGLPLIGATYTGLIEGLESDVAVGAEYADYLVLSTYVDFENWVKYSRLAPPKNADIRNPRYGEDETRSLTDRALILEINGNRANNSRAYELKKRYSATSDIGNIFKEGGGTTDADKGSMSDSQKSSFSSVYSLLSRHMTASLYTGSDYDGEVSGQIQKLRLSASKEDEKMILKMFTLSASDSRTLSQRYNPFDNPSKEDEAWMKAIYWNGENNDVASSAKGLFTGGPAANPLFQFGDYKYNIYNSGDLRYEAGKGFVSPNTDERVEHKTEPIGPDRPTTVGGLSPIAMYNFLNTSFSDTGLTVYSPQKTASDLSRDSYASVTFGGSGVSSVTKWFENVTVMLSLAVLSIAYGVMMVSVAIRSIPRILSGVFGTALGSIQFITKLLISTAVIIIQIIGMIFLYALSENIIMTMLLNFNELVDMGGSYFNSGVILEFLGSLLIITITATVTIFMIKNMKVFKEMMEEVVTNAINRVMGVLDTSTGGRGLDVSKTSGGRVGGNGELTDEAKQNDGRGLMGALESAASGGLIGGAAGLLGNAHDIESRNEQIAEELGLETGGIGGKIKARLGTAKDLANAKGKDIAKGLVGINGKSLEREMDAKKRMTNSMMYNQKAQDAFTAARGIKSDEEQDTTAVGQSVDENGDIITDENGDASDVNGNPISPATPFHAPPVGMLAKTNDDGMLLDTDGSVYTDENGNAFYQNEKGQLVDADNNFVALDKDGVLKPISEIPGHNGKPAVAVTEAKKLDSMRFNSDSYKDMKKEQNASHYGLDENGNAVNKKGEPLQYRDKFGQLKPAKLDTQGFVVDTDGKRLDSSQLVMTGGLDPRGFENVTDPETGETHVRHKGDEAMKINGANQNPNSQTQRKQSLTALARQANQAQVVAEKAQQRVDDLKAKGATPYAIQQAERYAQQARRQADVAQKRFNNEMQSATKNQNNPNQPIRVEPVTKDQVTSATRYAQSQHASLKENLNTLNDMKSRGASQQEIARQERKVEAQRNQTQQAQAMAQDMKVAQTTGRSYGEVTNARQRVDKAEASFERAQTAYEQAVSSGQPEHVIRKRQQAVQKASRILSNSHQNMERVSQAPTGTRAQIDQATARFEQAQMKHRQAEQHVQQLQQSGAPEQEVRRAKKREMKAQRKVEQARQVRQRLVEPKGWNIRSSEQPKRYSVPTVSPTKSYTNLASQGITNYDDYSQQVAIHMKSLKESQSKLQQAQQRLATLKQTNRPPQIIQQAQQQVQTLKSSVQSSQTNLKNLQDNAQGLLKNGGFQPVIASRPIRQNGGMIVNQLVAMGHTQAMYDKLAYQEQRGILSDAGKKQMQKLGGRLKHMRSDLVKVGIREDKIQDRAGILNSAKHMQQSWDSFLEGKSVEQ